jgi:acetyl-CoA C-acetyltransferase
MMRKVFVAGIGSTSFGKHIAIPIESLAVDAAAQAILDSGLERK